VCAQGCEKEKKEFSQIFVPGRLARKSLSQDVFRSTEKRESTAFREVELHNGIEVSLDFFSSKYDQRRAPNSFLHQGSFFIFSALATVFAILWACLWCFCRFFWRKCVKLCAD
jgi:hypothetical protein